MRDREIVGLWEAYLQVHQPKEEVEQLDEDFPKQVGDFLKRGGDVIRKIPGVAAVLSPVRGSGRKTPTKTSGGYRPVVKSTVGEEVENWVNSLIDEGYDLSEYTWEDMYEMYVNLDEEYDTFDAIIEYLVAEGYADTNESALVIMANMSEEWRDSIVEEIQIPRPQPQKYMSSSSAGSASATRRPDMSTQRDKTQAQRIKQTPLGARLTSPGGPVRNPGPATGPNGFLNRNR